jgi:hypothetical protein
LLSPATVGFESVTADTEVSAGLQTIWPMTEYVCALRADLLIDRRRCARDLARVGVEHLVLVRDEQVELFFDAS